MNSFAEEVVNVVDLVLWSFLFDVVFEEASDVALVLVILEFEKITTCRVTVVTLNHVLI